MKSYDIVQTAHSEIRAFVQRPDNRRLLPGTGSYSTPFRGGLFGEVEAAAVAAQLSSTPAEILWLGTNPCVPRSIAHVRQATGASGDFDDFERQAKSGLFGAGRWQTNGQVESDWNPIQKPRGSWGVYRDALSQTASLDRVAMANFIPWGSQNVGELLDGLGQVSESLADRVLKFSDHLNKLIVDALKPRLLVVPFSLGRNARLAAVGSSGLDLSVKKTADARRYGVPVGKRTFGYVAGECRRGELSLPAIFLPHPSSLRLSKPDKDAVVRSLASTMRELLS